MKPERDIGYLEDMRRYAGEAVEFLGDKSAADLRDDIRTQYATIRAAEIVGEAASQLSKPFKQAHPELAWRKAMGLRNELIHGYRGVQLAILVDTVRNDFAKLIADIDSILAGEPPP